MNTVKKILEEIKRGTPPDKLERLIPWKSLSEKDFKELTAVARSQTELLETYTLLVYLFRVAREKNPWMALEVLNLAVIHPMMTVADRQKILRSIRTRLDQLKDELASDNPAADVLKRYWLHEAEYYSANGILLNETGFRQEAIQNFQIAHGIFEQVGLFQQAESIKERIHLLEKDSSPEEIPPQAQTIRIDEIVDGAEEDALAITHPAQADDATAGSAQVAFREENNAQAENPDTTPSTITITENEKREDANQPLRNETRFLAEQIDQRNEILTGIQLEIQLFLERRAILQREVQALEKKLETIKTKIARAEKKNSPPSIENSTSDQSNSPR